MCKRKRRGAFPAKPVSFFKDFEVKTGGVDGLEEELLHNHLSLKNSRLVATEGVVEKVGKGQQIWDLDLENADGNRLGAP